MSLFEDSLVAKGYIPPEMQAAMAKDPALAKAVLQAAKLEYDQAGGFNQDRYAQTLQQMHNNSMERNAFLDDEGAFGGIRKSDNMTGSQRSGQSSLDWLHENYKPWANPAEMRNPVMEAQSAVSAMKDEQARRRAQEAEQLATQGYITKGDTTSFFTDRGNAGADWALGNTPKADMTISNIDPQYGGGFAMGMSPNSPMAYSNGKSLPPVQGNEQLNTAGYNPAQALGGSGVPMSAAEAYGTDHRGKGIYESPDKSNPSSTDAAVARWQQQQAGIKERVGDFFNPSPEFVADMVKKLQSNTAVDPKVQLDAMVSQGDLEPEVAAAMEQKMNETPPPPALLPNQVMAAPIDTSQITAPGAISPLQDLPPKNPQEILDAATAARSAHANAKLRNQPNPVNNERGLLPSLGYDIGKSLFELTGGAYNYLWAPPSKQANFGQAFDLLWNR